MTLLEAYERIEARLMDGTGRAVIPRYPNSPENPLKICAYRTPAGLKCAVGIFLPDEHPAYKFTGGVQELTNEFVDLPEIITENIDFMDNAQAIHDEESNWTGKVFNDRGKKLLKVLKETAERDNENE